MNNVSKEWKLLTLAYETKTILKDKKKKLGTIKATLNKKSGVYCRYNLINNKKIYWK